MKQRRDETSWQPTVISAAELNAFIAAHPDITVVDQYPTLLEDLFLLRNPQFKFNKNYREQLTSFIATMNPGSDQDGAWFYFPWSNTLAHYLPENLHFELRTGRNKLLITDEEQRIYYQSTITCLGMSVGSHVALTLAMTGGARTLRLADPDTISGDNLNRIRIGYLAVGLKKVIVAARAIYEINPYASIEIFPNGITEENATQLLNGATVVVEEMDNPFWKLRVRELARSGRIPVIMGTDNGDGIIADIERFDTDQNYPLLHGLAGDLTAEKLKTMNPTDLPKVAATIAGANLAPVRMIESVSQVGKTLYSWPQLGTAANLCGSAISYLARRIALRDIDIASGRYEVNLDGIFEKDWNSEKKKTQRENEKVAVLKKMGLK